MAYNNSLRYGFDWDREYFINLLMQYQIIMPIITALTIHPTMQYLLIFENKSMKKDLRIFYGLTHIALILNEWSFCFAFRIYPVLPIAALYCEGPLCRYGIDKQILLSILAVPVILIVSPFFPLSFRMHAMVQSLDSKWRFSPRIPTMLNALINIFLLANVAGFGYFGRDHDDNARLLQEPELDWLSKRGGKIFLFGPPANAQYFRWEILFLGVSIACISPVLLFLTVDSMANIAKSSKKMLSGSTQAKSIRMYYMFLVQCLGSFLCYILPLTGMLVAMIIDVSFIPGWMLALLRISLMLLFTVNGHQFCIYFMLKNTVYRRIVIQKFKRIALRTGLTDAGTMNTMENTHKTTVTVQNISNC